jgi:hypothetical protein
MTPPLLIWFGISFATLLSFYLPLAVVPASVVARGADPAAAGVSERQLRAWFDQELITEAGTRGLVHQGESEHGAVGDGESTVDPVEVPDPGRQHLRKDPW